MVRYYLIYIVALLAWGTVFPSAAKDFTVVIDAGHGGKDPGARGRIIQEKAINLGIALKLGKLIEGNCKDAKVVYTRKKDIFVPLHRRAEIANAAKADLFISIHTNSLASRNSRVQGTETYTLGLHRTEDNLEVAKKENAVILIEDDYQQRYAGFNPNSSESYIIFEFLQDKYMAQSVSFARLVQKQFRQSARRVDKGVHQAGFLVLRETSMPSVLIELGVETKKEEPPVSERSEDKKPQAKAQSAQPVFKIQILTSDRVLPVKSRLFKGLAPVGWYKEGGIYKYTYGESTDYNRILRLKRSKVDAKFKDAFIIAFKNGEKMNINQAIKEFKQNR